ARHQRQPSLHGRPRPPRVLLLRPPSTCVPTRDSGPPPSLFARPPLALALRRRSHATRTILRLWMSPAGIGSRGPSSPSGGLPAGGPGGGRPGRARVAARRAHGPPGREADTSGPAGLRQEVIRRGGPGDNSPVSNPSRGPAIIPPPSGRLAARG